MNQRLALVASVVRDYDEAIDFYVSRLGFTLVEDTCQLEQDKRGSWSSRRAMVAARPCFWRGPPRRNTKRSSASNRAEGFSCFSRRTTSGPIIMPCADSRYEFVREPKAADYGTVAVFKDLYGNLWDLVQFAARS